MPRTILRAAWALLAPVLLAASTGILAGSGPSTGSASGIPQAIAGGPAADAPGLRGPGLLTSREPAEWRAPDGFATPSELAPATTPAASTAPVPPPPQHASPPPPPPPSPASPPAPPATAIGGAAEEFALINQDRSAAGIPALAYSGGLARVAQYRAEDMLNRNYFSHYDPVTGQLAFVQLLKAWGIPYVTAGENIAWSTNPSMGSINTMFMNSPEHRANILSPSYHQVGIGVASNGVKIMVVEVFTN